MRHFTTFVTVGLLLGCSSGSGGGSAPSCADGGTCPSGMVCNASGQCVQSGGQGGAGGAGATAGTGGVGKAGSGATAGAAGSSGTSGDGGVSGVGGTGGSSGGGACAPAGITSCNDASTGSPACDTCLKTYCCTEIDTCLADPACSGALNCYVTNCSATDTYTCSTSAPCSECVDGFLKMQSYASDCGYTYCQEACPLLLPS